MARFERDFHASVEAPLTLDELLALLDESGSADRGTREDAIACYLSGSEGWRDALKRLGGAFAGGEAMLRERKD